MDLKIKYTTHILTQPFKYLQEGTCLIAPKLAQETTTCANHGLTTILKVTALYSTTLSRSLVLDRLQVVTMFSTMRPAPQSKSWESAWEGLSCCCAHLCLDLLSLSFDKVLLQHESSLEPRKLLAINLNACKSSRMFMQNQSAMTCKIVKWPLRNVRNHVNKASLEMVVLITSAK